MPKDYKPARIIKDMIRINALNGALYFHISDIVSFFTKNGMCYLIANSGGNRRQKWCITESSYNFLLEMSN